MAKPRFTDYVDLIHTLFDQFTQAQMGNGKEGIGTQVQIFSTQGKQEIQKKIRMTSSWRYY